MNHVTGRLARAFFVSGKRGRKRPDQREALANNANADRGARRFHGRGYRLDATARQARLSLQLKLQIGECAKVIVNRMLSIWAHFL